MPITAPALLLTRLQPRCGRACLRHRIHARVEGDGEGVEQDPVDEVMQTNDHLTATGQPAAGVELDVCGQPLSQERPERLGDLWGPGGFEAQFDQRAGEVRAGEESFDDVGGVLGSGLFGGQVGERGEAIRGGFEVGEDAVGHADDEVGAGREVVGAGAGGELGLGVDGSVRHGPCAVTAEQLEGGVCDGGAAFGVGDHDKTLPMQPRHLLYLPNQNRCSDWSGMRNLVYYVATSLDGYIADAEGDFSAFPQDPATLAALFERYPETCPTHVRDALGVTGEPRRFDTVLMGFRAFEPALTAGLSGGAYPHLRQIVVTHRDLPATPGLTTIAGDVVTQVAALKEESGRDIWLCGGGNLAAQLVDLIDEIQIKVNPVILGGGTPLLPHTGLPLRLALTDAETLPGGVVLLTHRVS